LLQLHIRSPPLFLRFFLPADRNRVKPINRTLDI